MSPIYEPVICGYSGGRQVVAYFTPVGWMAHGRWERAETFGPYADRELADLVAQAIAFYEVSDSTRGVNVEVREVVKQYHREHPATQTDWEGRLVPADEPTDAVILAWDVSPHPNGKADEYLLERSWQRMLACVRDQLDTFLDRCDDAQLREGVTLTFRVRPIRKSDYVEIRGQ